MPIADFFLAPIPARPRLRLPIPSHLAIGNWKSAIPLLSPESLNLNVNARRKIQLHQRINRLRGWIQNVHQALVRSDFKLLTRFLVHVWRAKHGPLVLYSRQGDRTRYSCARSFRSLNNFCGRLIEYTMIVSFQSDSDLFIQHLFCPYLISNLKSEI